MTLPFDLGAGVPGPGEALEGVIDTYVTVLRANLEEWWYTKDAEPHTAQWGRRLPPPPF